MLTKEKTIRKGSLGREQWNMLMQENFSAARLTALAFMVMGLYSESVSESVILLVPKFDLTQGPSWWYVHVSVRTSSKVSGGLWAGISSFLLSPPKFF